MAEETCEHPGSHRHKKAVPHGHCKQDRHQVGPSPGASAVPANMEPHMTAEAPRASALTMCPLFCTPPSVIDRMDGQFVRSWMPASGNRRSRAV